jgi:alkylated DNA repair dioxygenase AlkB
MDTPDLFQQTPSRPEGFVYRHNLISVDEERHLLEGFGRLSFKPFAFQGFTGNRRALSFGWEYNFNTREFRPAAEIPSFLLPVRNHAARFAKLDPNELGHVLLLEYPPGAGIGWHKDKPQFGKVIGVSLLSECNFRFRKKAGATWERASIVAEPRSVYLLDGPSRTEWEHSIPAVNYLRYSITFRTLVRKVN